MKQESSLKTLNRLIKRLELDRIVGAALLSSRTIDELIKVLTDYKETLTRCARYVGGTGGAGYVDDTSVPFIRTGDPVINNISIRLSKLEKLYKELPCHNER